jgi:adenosylhomocysteinase
MLANAGHFDVEISLADLRALSTNGIREVLPLVEQHEFADGRCLNLLASGRVVNLAAGQGHPAEIMDLSFANQALATEHLIRTQGSLSATVHPVPLGIDREIARLKLVALGVGIDALTEDQLAYLTNWG